MTIKYDQNSKHYFSHKYFIFGNISLKEIYFQFRRLRQQIAEAMMKSFSLNFTAEFEANHQQFRWKGLANTSFFIDLKVLL